MLFFYHFLWLYYTIYFSIVKQFFILFFILILLCMVSLSFSSCNKDKDQKVSNSERLIGEWIYRTTQEKTNGEWKDMPTQVGAEGAQTFYKDGKALITMTFKGE